MTPVFIGRKFCSCLGNPNFCLGTDSGACGACARSLRCVCSISSCFHKKERIGALRLSFLIFFWGVKSGTYIFTSLSDFLGPSNPCLTSPYVPVVPLLNQHATLYGGSPHSSRLLLLSRLHNFFNGRFQPAKRADRCFCGFFVVEGFRGGSGGCG